MMNSRSTASYNYQLAMIVGTRIINLSIDGCTYERRRVCLQDDGLQTLNSKGRESVRICQ